MFVEQQLARKLQRRGLLDQLEATILDDAPLADQFELLEAVDRLEKQKWQQVQIGKMTVSLPYPLPENTRIWRVTWYFADLGRTIGNTHESKIKPTRWARRCFPDAKVRCRDITEQVRLNIQNERRNF